MADLTPERLKELRRIAEAATPGPEEIITPSHPVFDSTTVLVLLDEIERLRREREVMAEVLQHVYTCENCECATCPQGAELSYRAYRALGEAMDLLNGEKIVGNVTRFVL